MDKIYIAASYPRKAEALDVAAKMKAMGYCVVSSWLYENEGYHGEDIDVRMRASARRDLQEIQECDMLVSLVGDDQTHGGRHSELGVALALGKIVIIIGAREQVFHWHSAVTVFNNVEEFYARFA